MIRSRISAYGTIHGLYIDLPHVVYYFRIKINFTKFLNRFLVRLFLIICFPFETTHVMPVIWLWLHFQVVTTHLKTASLSSARLWKRSSFPGSRRCVLVKKKKERIIIVRQHVCVGFTTAGIIILVFFLLSHVGTWKIITPDERAINSTNASAFVYTLANNFWRRA